MINIDGDSWFPITGNLILKDNIPLCSVPDDAKAYGVMEALAHWNKGQPFTCISRNGYYCKQVDDKPEESKD